MSLGDLAAQIGRKAGQEDTSEIVDIIEFVESPWGLGLDLYPIQRVILKAHYGIALDDNPYGFPLDEEIPKNHPCYDEDLVDEDGFYKYRVVITDFRRENRQVFTEAGYLAYLYDEGRCNIREVVPGQQRREMILSIGRRSGKTLITSCIVAYETYKLLKKYNAQKYYGTSQSNIIQLISVATGKDQSKLLFNEAKGHFSGCDFFLPYTANNTQSFYTFQSAYDIDRYGPYKDNPKAPFSFNVTFQSCVAKGLRGGNNILVALDEAAHFGDSGQASADQVYQAVAPSTRTFSPKDPNNKTRAIGENEGRVIMISSPLGKQGLFYKQFRVGFDREAGENFLCVQAPTWEVNPTIPAATFIADYLKDPVAFFTEFGAEFTDRTRGWLNPDDIYACINPNRKPRGRASPRAPHFLGLDIGLVGDYTAVAVGHNDPDGKIVLDYIDRIKAGEGEYEDYDRLEFEDVVDWVADIARRFYITEGLFDQKYGIVMEQALARRGLERMTSMQFSQRVASEIFQNFMNLLMDRRLDLYNWPIPADDEYCDYIQELKALQAEILSKYVVKVEAPRSEGNHDDYSDALVRMVWLATQNSAKRHTVTGARSSRGMAQVTEGRPFYGRNPARGRKGGMGSHPSRQVKRKKTRGGRR